MGCPAKASRAFRSRLHGGSPTLTLGKIICVNVGSGVIRDAPCARSRLLVLPTHCDQGSGPLSAPRAVSQTAVQIKKGVCREAGALTRFKRCRLAQWTQRHRMMPTVMRVCVQAAAREIRSSTRPAYALCVCGPALSVGAPRLRISRPETTTPLSRIAHFKLADASTGLGEFSLTSCS
jgi:hypothetical protein